MKPKCTIITPNAEIEGARCEAQQMIDNRTRIRTWDKFGKCHTDIILADDDALELATQILRCFAQNAEVAKEEARRERLLTPGEAGIAAGKRENQGDGDDPTNEALNRWEGITHTHEISGMQCEDYNNDDEPRLVETEKERAERERNYGAPYSDDYTGYR